MLVVGGVGTGLTAPSAAELYDPQTDSWTQTAPMQTLRRGHSATLLPDGSVLVAGGVDPTDETYTVLASTERFDPTTLTWHPAAPLETPRLHHLARLLPDGTVLVDGGENNSGPAATVERYHPAQDRWQTLPAPTNGRIGHSAALRLDGTLLIAGGTVDFFNELDEVRSWTPPTSQTAPTLTAALYLTAAVQITGEGFSSAVAGNPPSPSSHPLLQLRSLDNEQLLWPGLARAAVRCRGNAV
ncbi:MAG: Kelch repeat-containing protein, partial [Caldilinea sp.]